MVSARNKREKIMKPDGKKRTRATLHTKFWREFNLNGNNRSIEFRESRRKTLRSLHGFVRTILFKMQSIQQRRFILTMYKTIKYYSGAETNTFQSKKNRIISSYLCKSFHSTHCLREDKQVAKALRTVKPKSQSHTTQYFVDLKQVRTKGGTGGDGAISFLQLWVNDRAGPDGGDGGHGGHVIFKATTNIKDLSNVHSILEGEDGENGANKDCFGKNAAHTIVDVPLGTIVRDVEGNILADLDEDGMMYLAARGGSGGHGNAFFKSDINQAPKVAEYGAEGESTQYVLEVRSMAHVGLIGLPNAGKSTLLRAISRARPKVADYPFTTLKPHIGMIQYEDYEQIAVADLPGLIPDSHKNKGLGITFLKHAERCAALLFIIDITQEEPWTQLEILEYEIYQFNEKLMDRPKIIIANKMDLPKSEENLVLLRKKIDAPIIPISAKIGTNISTLLREIRILYDEHLNKKDGNDKV